MVLEMPPASIPAINWMLGSWDGFLGWLLRKFGRVLRWFLQRVSRFLEMVLAMAPARISCNISDVIFCDGSCLGSLQRKKEYATTLQQPLQNFLPRVYIKSVMFLVMAPGMVSATDWIMDCTRALVMLPATK